MTAQIPDRIVIDGIDWLLLSTPLDSLLSDLRDRIPTYVGPHTANWRGYTAAWQIADGWLFLESVEASVEGPDGSLVTVEDGAALDGRHLPVLADWVTGQLRVGRGDQVRHVHAGFESRWEQEELIEVRSGQVTERRPLAEAGAMGSAGPYQLHESLLGDALSGGAFGQVMLATDLDGRSLVAKAARPRGGDGGTEMWADTPHGERPLHVPARAFRRNTAGGWSVESVAGDTLQDVLRNEAELLERDGGRLLPLSYGLWSHDPSGVPVLVMERLEGRRPSSPDDVVAILSSLRDAVQRGTFDAHGDVKLEHLFISDAGVRMCDPAPRFDVPGRRGFTPLYNPRGWSGPAADVAACATILRYMNDVGWAGWRWCADVLDSTAEPDWVHDHGRALNELATDLARADPPPPGWVVPALRDSVRRPPVATVEPLEPVEPVVEAIRRVTHEVDEITAALEVRSLGVPAPGPDAVVVGALEQLRRAVDGAAGVLDRSPLATTDGGSPLLGHDSITVEVVPGGRGGAPDLDGLAANRQDPAALTARFDALVGASPLDDRDLRGWEMVLHGSLVLHSSAVAPESMRGRYAAAWDSADKIAVVVSLLEMALLALRRSISRVVAAPDRNSQIIARTIASRLGLPEPEHMSDRPPADATTLLVMFDWSVDALAVERWAHDADVVLFAYCLDWTREHLLAPDIVGLHVQAMTPAWGAQLRIEGDPANLHHPDPEQRARVVDVPADDRPVDHVAAQLVEAAFSIEDVTDASVPLCAVIDAAGTIPGDVGALGGRRARYVPGGPVASARFT